MPLVGLIPFLLTMEKAMETLNNMCVNALSRAYPISTKKMKELTTRFQDVSMP